MSVWLISVLVTVWLLCGLATGAAAHLNDHSIAKLPWPGRLGVVLLGPLTVLGWIIYGVGYIGVPLILEIVVLPTLNFIRGR